MSGFVRCVRAVPMLLLSLNLCGESSRPAELPPIIHAQDVHVTAPLWVDAEAAVDSRGRLRRDLFPFTWEGMLRDFRGTSTGDENVSTTVKYLEDDEQCDGVVGNITGDSLSGDAPPQTLQELADSAVAIYIGTVVAMRPGFVQDVPASLLEADASVIRSFGEASSATQRIHLVYQYARFAVGELVACSGLRPVRVGDRFVAFVSTPPRDTQHLLIVPEDLFVESVGGSVTSNHRWMTLLNSASEGTPGLETVISAARRSELKRRSAKGAAK